MGGLRLGRFMLVLKGVSGVGGGALGVGKGVRVSG
jgi:hypothetical protein